LTARSVGKYGSDMTRQEGAHSVAKLKQARSWLAIGGVAFIIAGLSLIGWADGPGSSTVATTAPVPTATTGATATTQTTTVVTTSGHQARGSDTLNVFLLGYGVALLLIFVFYRRIAKVVLPGGVEIDLTPLSSAKLVDEVHKQLPEATPHERERALRKALVELADAYWGKTASPPEKVLKDAATHAAEMVRAEGTASPAAGVPSP